MGSEPKVPEAVPARRRPGRPAGSRTKPKEGLGRGRLRDALADSLTQKDVDNLEPKTKADLLVRMEPKERKEPPANFTLSVYGLPGWECHYCGRKQPRDSRAPEAAVPAAAGPSHRDAPRPFTGETSEEFDCGGSGGEVET